MTCFLITWQRMRPWHNFLCFCEWTVRTTDSLQAVGQSCGSRRCGRWCVVKLPAVFLLEVWERVPCHLTSMQPNELESHLLETWLLDKLSQWRFPFWKHDSKVSITTFTGYLPFCKCCVNHMTKLLIPNSSLIFAGRNSRGQLEVSTAQWHTDGGGGLTVSRPSPICH